MNGQLGQPKIFVPITTDDNDNVGGETLFANRLRDGDEGQGVYELDCVPLFADLHHGDVVACDESNPDTLPTLVAVLERQELTTVHLLFTPKAFQEEERRRVQHEVLSGLTTAGFFYEQVEGKLYVVNAASDRLDELDRFLADFPTAIRWWRD